MDLDFLLELPIINLLPEPIQALLLLSLFVLIIMLIKAILLHPIYSRIAGLIVAVIAFIVGLNIPDDLFYGKEAFGAIWLSLIYTFSFVFASGAEVFDTYWDGTYTLSISRDRIDLDKTIVGGFLSNFMAGALVGYFLSILALSSMPFLLWLIPVILALINIVLLWEVISG